MTQTTAAAFSVLDLPAGERDLIGLARVSTDAQDARDRPPVADVGPGGILYLDGGLDGPGGEDPHDS